MTAFALPAFDPAAASFDVDVMDARAIPVAVRAAWGSLRKSNPALWSPYFDIRTTDVLARHAKDSNLLVAYEQGEIAAIFPFQGKKNGLIRPLGAPMSDQHGLICAPSCKVSLAAMLKRAGATGFTFSGLLSPISGSLGASTSSCHVADLSGGYSAYAAWQKANWNDQIKKNARRMRQGQTQWGPMRVETACPKTSTHFETLMAWKQAKYIETNRHNVLGVTWIQDCLRDLYHSRDPDFRGEITCLYFGEHLAALEFGLRAGTVMHSWFPAFDRTYAQVSPGILLMDGMIELCARQGITKVDLGVGHAQYKRHASNAPFEVYGGTFPVSPLRRVGVQTYLATKEWLSHGGSNADNDFLGRFQRRHEMILSSEPTLGGRIKGFANALKAFRAVE